MIFLDTCVWIELLSVKTPIKPNEIMQASAASTLLNDILSRKDMIVTCKEQLLELVSAIEKVKQKEVNKERKSNHQRGLGSLKEFRKAPEFAITKELCESVVNDVMYFAAIKNIGEYDINAIIQRLELADLNDCLYYDYCVKEDIDFYTFDGDLVQLGGCNLLHTYQISSQSWL